MTILISKTVSTTSQNGINNNLYIDKPIQDFNGWSYGICNVMYKDDQKKIRGKHV